MAITESFMYQDFKEAELGINFCRHFIQQVRELINASTSFSIVGIPGMGISIFLRYLATQSFAYFIHIDIYELPELNERELFKLILKELTGENSSSSFEATIEQIKSKLQVLTSRHNRIVLIFNRFDRLKSQFNQNFFMHLRVIRDIDKEKIVMIFAANKPLLEQISDELSGGNLNMLSQNYYLKPYSKKDLQALIKLNSPNLKLKRLDLEKALELSGGHYQLLQLLLKSEFLTNHPLQGLPIKLQIKELYEFLSLRQRKTLQSIVFKKQLRELDPYLLNVGFIHDNHDGTYLLFTPLLEEYIELNSRLRLPLREEKLFRLLKSRLGKITYKDEIFETIWEDSEEATDWALNSLIYRLRKNPTFIAKNYVIESRKKAGYVLLKN